MAKQGGLKTVKNIVKAYTTPLPVNEKWYQDRLEICNTCEFNSKNAKTEELNMLEKLSFNAKKSVCGGEDHCTACGCCIKRKASVKSEQCGISKLDEKERIKKGIEPKWLALEINSEIHQEIIMSNLTPLEGTISKEKFNFVYDLGEVSEKVKHFSFALSREKGFEVKDYAAGCKCSVGAHRQVSNKKCEFDMAISTETFTTGVKTSRTFTVNYYAENNRTKSVVIIFKIIRK